MRIRRLLHWLGEVFCLHDYEPVRGPLFGGDLHRCCKCGRMMRLPTPAELEAEAAKVSRWLL